MSNGSRELSALAHKDRARRIVQWTRDGLTRDADVYAGVVWWGYWRQVGGEDSHPPDALFPTEDEAEAWGLLVGQLHDWHVGPVVLQIEARDNFEVPK